ncbi:MAG: 16S rRNA (guanine(966)-N(2))-methyltransferase RsmD [Alphaproteobacteria bacterium]|nr:16S rRNA (guanine(966)-N(2))-methyltransferase RsmD [Alphaproteobacteria bacterium]
MRIIGGTLSGRKIAPPVSRTTRPMMDRVRESLFNILAHHEWGRPIGDPFNSTYVLDAFCGTGALAFEAISRGAKHATLFDLDRQALQVATKNAAALEIEDNCDILQMDALAPMRAPKTCKLIFLAPPYRKGLIPPAMIALNKAGWIAPHALIVAETAKKETLDLPEGYVVTLSRYYADTGLHFIVRD